jgi:hypothetical protein
MLTKRKQCEIDDGSRATRRAMTALRNVLRIYPPAVHGLLNDMDGLDAIDADTLRTVLVPILVAICDAAEHLSPHNVVKWFDAASELVAAYLKNNRNQHPALNAIENEIIEFAVKSSLSTNPADHVAVANDRNRRRLRNEYPVNDTRTLAWAFYEARTQPIHREVIAAICAGALKYAVQMSQKQDRTVERIARLSDLTWALASLIPVAGSAFAFIGVLANATIKSIGDAFQADEIPSANKFRAVSKEEYRQYVHRMQRQYTQHIISGRDYRDAIRYADDGLRLIDLAINAGGLN